MRRHSLAFMLMLIPSVSPALQLSWSSGASTLSFTEATRCTLVVSASAEEQVLPSEWRLLWVSDCSSIQPLVLDPQEACQGDTAQVSEVDLPITPADSAANMTTAHFCSGGAGAAAMAFYFLDLPAGAAGKLKVVAIDPTDPDSSRVLHSSVVEFNGGTDGAFSPVVLRASISHPSVQLTVTAVGAGLEASTSASIVAADTSWRVPLDILQHTDSKVTAVADVPTPLPAAVFQVSAPGGAIAEVALGPDVVTVQPMTLASSTLFTDPNPAVEPKDFAFVYNTVPNPWRGMFHLIYIRKNKNLSGDATERTFGHAWSHDLTAWRVDTAAFAVQAVWDSRHVWAPSVVQNGNKYYMFYTGVGSDHNQRTGYATTIQLDTTNTMWARESTWVFSADSTSWADPVGHLVAGQQQFRDPFVFPHPNADSAGVFFMLYTAEDTRFIPNGFNTVGLARNRLGTLARWLDLAYYRRTDIDHFFDGDVESPHVFPDSGTTSGWRIMLTSGNGSESQSIDFTKATAGTGVTDTALVHWGGRVHLFAYLGGDSTVYGWRGTEHLKAGTVDFLAGYDGVGIAIARMYWNGSNFTLKQPSLVAVGEGDQGTAEVRLLVTELQLGAPRVGLRIDLPRAMPVRLSVYDVMGRRVRTLAAGRLPEGVSAVTWDCRDAHGGRVGSGVYFARLAWSAGDRVVRMPVIR